MQPIGIRTRIIAAALSLLISGCEEDGPVSYKLSGLVTYDGRPVPKGLVTLSPEGGPETRISIENGLYGTAEGQGIDGGVLHVRIVGFDGVATRWQGEDLPEGKSLFSPYQATVDFPRQDGEYHFAIKKVATSKVSR